MSSVYNGIDYWLFFDCYSLLFDSNLRFFDSDLRFFDSYLLFFDRYLLVFVFTYFFSIFSPFFPFSQFRLFVPFLFPPTFLLVTKSFLQNFFMNFFGFCFLFFFLMTVFCLALWIGFFHEKDMFWAFHELSRDHFFTITFHAYIFTYNSYNMTPETQWWEDESPTKIPTN